LAALLANGLYVGLERSQAIDDVDAGLFEVPWWYRSTWTATGGGRTAIRLDGVVHKADVFVNGAYVAGADQTAGAFSVTEFDVTDLAVSGANSVALKVYPGSPEEDLSISWVDWARRPPDNNMGVWRDVVVQRTGDVGLGPPAVTTDLALPGMERAGVTISVELANLSGEDLVAELRGVVTGPGTMVTFGDDVAVGAFARQTVTFGPHDTAGLALASPAVWWPVGEGDQPLYDVQLSASVGRLLSDQRSTSFGVRSVTSFVADGGGRRFVVNGRELQVMGAGWAPDLFLRYDYERTASELSYALDLGLNTIRLEGKLENEEFFALTDAAGLMVLPGWECCSKWEAEKREDAKPWSELDFVVAARQMASEAVLLRNHPSVIGFLIGSDFAPTPRAAASYVEALTANRWPLPIVSSATTEGTDAAGASGMKMTGPYSYVPPVYWYSTDPERGGAIGFNSETSAGNTVPRLVNLRRMLSDEEIESLWRQPQAPQVHAGPPSDFDNLAVFHRALAGRYGAPTSVEDFCRKAQLANYETVRAQFEAYASRAFSDQPATGVIYWMFNSPWPSLNWQLYDWYLGTGGAYYGAKKANERVHAVYAYDTGCVQVVNRGADNVGPYRVTAAVRDITGAVVSSDVYDIGAIPGRGVARVGQVAAPEGGGPTYFLALDLSTPDGGTITRNVYWLSTTPDVLDWDQGPWHHTPLSQFADLTGLQDLPPADVDVAVTPGPLRGGRRSARVVLRNISPRGTPAVGLHVSVLGVGSERTPISPVVWDDNDVTLFGGDEVNLIGSYPAGRVGRAIVEVDGFNVVARETPLS
jgi:exo-1,4-beta-D-glucosaminidase